MTMRSKQSLCDAVASTSHSRGQKDRLFEAIFACKWMLKINQEVSVGRYPIEEAKYHQILLWIPYVDLLGDSTLKERPGISEITAVGLVRLA